MFVFLTLCSALVASALSYSTCAERGLTAIDSFNLPDILGTWWEWKRNEANEQTGDCVKGNYTASFDAKVFNIEVTRVDAGGTPKVYYGIVTSNATSGWNGYLLAYLYSQNRPYNVLSFEPSEHLLLYNCIDTDSGIREEMWFMVRNRYPTAEQAEKFDAILDSFELDGPFYKDNQDESFCGSN